MRKMAFLLACISFVVFTIGSLSASDSLKNTVTNDYFSFTYDTSGITNLYCDPYGQQNFTQPMLEGILLPPACRQIPGVKVSCNGSSLRFENIRTPIHASGSPEVISSRESKFPYRLCPGMTLGQRFRITDGKFYGISLRVPTWMTTSSGFTITLMKRGSPSAIIFKKTYPVVTNDAWLEFSFPAQEPGDYFLELSNPVGTIGCYTNDTGVIGDGEFYYNGLPISDRDMTCAVLGWGAISEETFALTIDIDRNKVNAFVDSASSKNAQLQLEIVTDWIKHGYDCESLPFSRFISDKDHYLCVQQLKRRNDAVIEVNDWLSATAQNASADIRIYSGCRVPFAMSEVEMRLYVPLNCSIEFLPPGQPLPAHFPVFTASDQDFAMSLTELYYERAFSFFTPCGASWVDWPAIISAWCPGMFRDLVRQSCLGIVVGDDGYVYSWGDKPGWPLPDNDKYDTRHFITNAGYITRNAKYYLWTHDNDFLSLQIEKLRKTMEFQLVQLQGSGGLMIIDIPNHHGTKYDISSNYWDDIPFGYKSAYDNIYFFESLMCMAEIERAASQLDLPEKGFVKSPEYYESLAAEVKKNYNKEFWDEHAGRYIGCIDKNGEHHDYGFTYLNTEALTYGLGDAEKAARIFAWMENEPTASGSADTYSKYIFAPRCNTIDNQDWWFLDGTFPNLGYMNFGSHLENGGAIFYTSFYDLMSRIKYKGADDAYRRLTEILDRHAKPDKICGGSPLFFGEINEWEVGTDIPFPESGLVPAIIVHGFLGLSPCLNGLQVRPAIPSTLDYIGIKNLEYAGGSFNITASRINNTIEVELSAKPSGRTFDVPGAIEKKELSEGRITWKTKLDEDTRVIYHEIKRNMKAD